MASVGEGWGTNATFSPAGEGLGTQNIQGWGRSLEWMPSRPRHCASGQVAGESTSFLLSALRKIEGQTERFRNEGMDHTLPNAVATASQTWVIHVLRRTGDTTGGRDKGVHTMVSRENTLCCLIADAVWVGRQTGTTRYCPLPTTATFSGQNPYPGKLARAQTG